MSEDNKTESAMSGLATQLMKDPDAQKAFLDMTQPILQMQETIFQQIIDQQNKILVALQVVCDNEAETKATLAEILKEMKK